MQIELIMAVLSITVSVLSGVAAFFGLRASFKLKKQGSSIEIVMRDSTGKTKTISLTNATQADVDRISSAVDEKKE